MTSYLLTALETVLALTIDPSSSDRDGSGERKYKTEKVMRSCSISIDSLTPKKIHMLGCIQMVLTLQAEAL